MCQEREFLSRESEERAAGGNELERSESSFPPAGRPKDAGPAKDESLPTCDTVPDAIPALGESCDARTRVTDRLKDEDRTEQVPPTDCASRGAQPNGNDRNGDLFFAELGNDASLEALDDRSSDEPPPDLVDEGGELEPDDLLAWEDDPPPMAANLGARRRGTLAKPSERLTAPLSPTQKLLLLDTWLRSGLPARDFGALVHISRHTLYAWKHRFEQLGPAGLMEQPRGARTTQRGRKSFLLTRVPFLVCCWHATANSCNCGRVGVPCPESGRGADAAFPQGGRLCRNATCPSGKRV